MGPSAERVLPICSNGSVPLNKMAAMSICGKNSSCPEQKKTLLVQNQESFVAESWYHHCLKVYQVCSNVDRMLTFDHFMARSNLPLYRFV